MDAEENRLATLWHDIAELLAKARIVRPLHRDDALLDLTRVMASAGPIPLLACLAEVLEGWCGRLLIAVPDDALAPALQGGDRLVVDPGAVPTERSVVIALVCGSLSVRCITFRGGRQWLGTSGDAALPLEPTVAILGVAVEVRRPLAGMGEA